MSRVVQLSYVSVVAFCFSFAILGFARAATDVEIGQSLSAVCQRGDLTRLKELLTREPGSINIKCEDGRTPLVVASACNRTELALFRNRPTTDICTAL